MSTECVSTFYIVGKAEKQAKRWELKAAQSALARFTSQVGLRIDILSLVKEEQSAVSMFYIVDKLKEQAKRWKLKAGQSALACFTSQVDAENIQESEN